MGYKDTVISNDKDDQAVHNSNDKNKFGENDNLLSRPN